MFLGKILRVRGGSKATKLELSGDDLLKPELWRNWQSRVLVKLACKQFGL